MYLANLTRPLRVWVQGVVRKDDPVGVLNKFNSFLKQYLFSKAFIAILDLSSSPSPSSAPKADSGGGQQSQLGGVAAPA